MFAPPARRANEKKTFPQEHGKIAPKSRYWALHGLPFDRQAGTQQWAVQQGTNYGPAAPARTPLPSIQPKLDIAPVDDPLEREADQVAEAIMGMPAGDADPSDRPAIAGRCDFCGSGHAQAQADRPERAWQVPQNVHDVLASTGRSLETSARAFFEPRFGRNFGGVRIHDDARAASSAAAVGARAYTSGSHIVFAGGSYAPASRAGRRLLAHELTHVVQQTGLVDAAPDHVRTRIAPTPAGGAADRIFRQAAPVCRPTNRWPGNMEHALIEDDYIVNVNPMGGATEYLIPQSGPYGGTGYADMVDTVGHKIYEVKTFLGAPGGVVEAARYAAMANLHCPPPIPQASWTVGNDYPMRTIPFSATHELVAQQYPAFPGVVVYYRRQRRTVPVPQPVPVPVPVAIPQTAMQRIREFLRSVVETGQNAEEAAARFLREHPELIYVIAGTAVLIFVATIVEDIVTFGAGIADDPATMGAAWALWQAAMRMQGATR